MGMRFCFSTALGGVLLFSLAGFFPDGRPLLSNYIPVTTHPLYLAGLLLFMFSVALNYLSAFSKASNPVYEQLNVDRNLARGLQWGVRLGSIYFLVGMAVLLYSTTSLPTNYRDEAFYEIGVWGYGHLQQFSNLIFMLVSWILLLTSWSKKPLLSKSFLYFIFGLYVLPLLATLPLLAHEPSEFRYRQGFTDLMRWGTFPPCLLFLIYLAIKIFKSRRQLDFSDYRFLIFMCSAILLLIGFIFGAFVRGPDLRLPGHYHATIGAVTLAFMGAVFILIDSISGVSKKSNEPLRRLSPLLYGLGQLGFSAGMFISGSFGMGRKMYGVEQQIQNFGQSLGLWIMGVGGILALAGGFVFAKASLPSILKLFLRRTRLRPS